VLTPLAIRWDALDAVTPRFVPKECARFGVAADKGPLGRPSLFEVCRQAVVLKVLEIGREQCLGEFRCVQTSLSGLNFQKQPGALKETPRQV